jgi:hypothetical protein
MSKRTNPIEEALNRAGSFINDLPGGGEDFNEARPKADKEVARLLRIERVVKGMFDDSVLDPYPTSDGDPQYILRKLTGWKPKKERK